MEIEQMAITGLAEIAAIPASFLVDRILRVDLVDGGLGGITLTDEPVDDPWVKDYDAAPGHHPSQWSERFDVTAWGLLMAMDGGRAAGAAVLAIDTPAVEMLEGRSELAVLWDLRVLPEARSSGMGTRLFEASLDLARTRGVRELIVETQNVNVPACRLYRSVGCTLRSIDRHAYPDHPDEVQLLWSLAV